MVLMLLVKDEEMLYPVGEREINEGKICMIKRPLSQQQKMAVHIFLLSGLQIIF